MSGVDVVDTVTEFRFEVLDILDRTESGSFRVQLESVRSTSTQSMLSGVPPPPAAGALFVTCMVYPSHITEITVLPVPLATKNAATPLLTAMPSVTEN